MLNATLRTLSVSAALGLGACATSGANGADEESSSSAAEEGQGAAVQADESAEEAATDEEEAVADSTPTDQAAPTIDPSGVDTAAIVASVNTTAGRLFAAVAAGDDGNVLVSPVSVAGALHMTMAGAVGPTLEEMAAALATPGSGPEMHQASGALQALLAAPGEATVDIANRVYIERSWAERIRPEYRSVVQSSYGAGLADADFVNAAEQARTEINGWVAGITHDKIPELIPMGVLDSLTRLVLTNAVYFNADWAEPFDVDRTVDGAFFAPGGEVVAPLMFRMDDIGYAESDAWQAARLPYAGAEFDMLVVLPKGEAGTVLDDPAGAFAEAGASLDSTRVAFTMPRFTFRWSDSLVAPLQQMGIQTAFGRAADFSGMADLSNTDGLYVSDVRHEAFIEVDEEGTEAAAATAVIVATRAGVRQDIIEMRCDRPFYFAIRHTDTGALLFVGRLADPTAE